MEAAIRLATEIRHDLQEHPESKHWDILAHMFLDVSGTQSRLLNSSISAPEKSIPSFMHGFMTCETAPLFYMSDIGPSREMMHGKIEGKSIQTSKGVFYTDHVRQHCSTCMSPIHTANASTLQDVTIQDMRWRCRHIQETQ